MKYPLLTLFLLSVILCHAQPPNANYDESKVPEYELPTLLKSNSGRKIKQVKQWEKIRRPEILKLFKQEVYGSIPGELPKAKVLVYEDGVDALGGTAIRKQLDLVFDNGQRELSMGILIYLPKSEAPVPVILGYNFLGNHAIYNDPSIRISESWVYDQPAFGIVHNQFTEPSRGFDSESWQLEKILEAGFGLVTVYYGDVDPDKNDFSDGIHPFLYRTGQEVPAADEWGSMAAWAWGLSQVMDYLETDLQVNSKQVVVFGHSRLGKAALWAGASDQRFAAVISNDSGCMGAALSRRKFGETIAVANKNFPNWFCGNFKKYSNYEDRLPIDQHMLLALVAPRPLYVASATEDLWADPKGEFLSAKEASKVYNLFEIPGLTSSNWPAPETPVGDLVSYHLRIGTHSVTGYDWDHYLAWARKNVIR